MKNCGRFPGRSCRVRLLFVEPVVADQAVAAVLALVNDGDRILCVHVAEDEELMPQQIHLQDGLLHAHGLDRETLAAHDLEFLRVLLL